MPHPDHELAGPSPEDWNDAWSEYVIAEHRRAFDDLSPAEQTRQIRALVSEAVSSGTPLHELLPNPEV